MMVKRWISLIIWSAFASKILSQPGSPLPDVFVKDACFCVTKGWCNRTTQDSSNDGIGMIDVRVMSGSGADVVTGASNLTLNPASSGVKLIVDPRTSCHESLDLCCPAEGFSCGKVYPPVVQAPQADVSQGEAIYGAFPWQAAIMMKPSSYVASGALIDHVHVLTAAHKVHKLKTDMFVRLGEWDSGRQNEPFEVVEINVAEIIIHPNFNSGNLKYDLAIIRLSSKAPLGLNPVITNICLSSSPIPVPMRCWISGWGKNVFSSISFMSIIKTVDVPMVDYDSCLQKLRATRLGNNFILDSASFVCAGGETNKDACTNDGGSPLACSTGGRWFLTGLVAWGIGCGTKDVPGVYVNIFNLTSWIQEIASKTVLQVDGETFEDIEVRNGDATVTTVKDDSIRGPTSAKFDATSTKQVASSTTTRITSKPTTLATISTKKTLSSTTKSTSIESALSTKPSNAPTISTTIRKSLINSTALTLKTTVKSGSASKASNLATISTTKRKTLVNSTAPTLKTTAKVVSSTRGINMTTFGTTKANPAVNAKTSSVKISPTTAKAGSSTKATNTNASSLKTNSTTAKSGSSAKPTTFSGSITTKVRSTTSSKTTQTPAIESAELIDEEESNATTPPLRTNSTTNKSGSSAKSTTLTGSIATKVGSTVTSKFPTTLKTSSTAQKIVSQSTTFQPSQALTMETSESSESVDKEEDPISTTKLVSFTVTTKSRDAITASKEDQPATSSDQSTPEETSET